ncbi:MAG: helix-turn-helix transcriptional regulator [Clostridia bacterium]|nr:helix-turn-helix transcriptional regulator [Clostridia bacterium]
MLRLKELRKKDGLSQQQLAEQLGITQATLSGWENEKYEIDNTSLLKCSDIFNVTTDYLLGRTDDPHPMPNMNITRERAKELLRKPQNPDTVLISVQGSSGENETIEMPKKEFDDLMELKKVLHRQMLKHLED